MVKIVFLKPFYAKCTEKRLRLVFAYQYLSIERDEEVYHFIPIEGKEIVFDLENYQVQNLSEVFVFQRGNRFIRMPLYQFLLITNVYDYLMPIINHHTGSGGTALPNGNESKTSVKDEELEELISELEEKNLLRMIDEALEVRDEKRFAELSSMLRCHAE